MAKWAEREEAIRLLRRHPGWGDKRVARVVGVAHTTVKRWRWEAGLAPALKKVGTRRRRAQLVATPLGEALVERVRSASAAKKRRT